MVTGEGVSRETKTGATVKRERSRFGAYLAWCEHHQDGERFRREPDADDWAARHNSTKHKESNE